jgi:enamine deaminase RidA (YjgF/YER057c/UK114 family)
MGIAEKQWEEVGASWRELGEHLQEQYRKLGENQAQQTREDREQLNAAAKRLSEHLGKALDSMGDVVKDPQTKDSVKRVVHAMGDAISTTFEDVGDEIRGRLPKREGEAVAAAPDPAASSPN